MAEHDCGHRCCDERSDPLHDHFLSAADCCASDQLPPVLLELLDEVQRQDRLHQYGYACTRDGVRLALCTAKDEITEAEDAWRSERCRCPDPHCGCSKWAETRKEAMQAAAVLVRLIRSLEATDA